MVPPDEPKAIPKEPSANTSPKRERGSVHASFAHADCPPVRAIVVNPRLTGGNDTDGKFGDEGVMLVLETKGDDGKLVDAPGDLSLTILDPAESGEMARVAHWEFTSDEMAQHFRRLRFGQGYVFELPWPGEPPKHEQLTLRVRLTTLDGRTLTTAHDFKAEILGHDEFVTRSVRRRASARGHPTEAAIPRLLRRPMTKFHSKARESNSAACARRFLLRDLLQVPGPNGDRSVSYSPRMLRWGVAVTNVTVYALHGWLLELGGHYEIKIVAIRLDVGVRSRGLGVDGNSRRTSRPGASRHSVRHSAGRQLATLPAVVRERWSIWRPLLGGGYYGPYYSPYASPPLYYNRIALGVYYYY